MLGRRGTGSCIASASPAAAAALLPAAAGTCRIASLHRLLLSRPPTPQLSPPLLPGRKLPSATLALLNRPSRLPPTAAAATAAAAVGVDRQEDCSRSSGCCRSSSRRRRPSCHSLYCLGQAKRRLRSGSSRRASRMVSSWSLQGAGIGGEKQDQQQGEAHGRADVVRRQCKRAGSCSQNFLPPCQHPRNHEIIDQSTNLLAVNRIHVWHEHPSVPVPAQASSIC